jgi:hypothetical protein
MVSATKFPYTVGNAEYGQVAAVPGGNWSEAQQIMIENAVPAEANCRRDWSISCQTCLIFYSEESSACCTGLDQVGGQELNHRLTNTPQANTHQQRNLIGFLGGDIHSQEAVHQVEGDICHRTAFC